MDHDESEVKQVPLPDARTAYWLHQMKDRIIGTVVDWTLVQPEYWPVIECMEDHEKAADRNAVFIIWTTRNISDVKIRDEVWRRVELAYEDPDDNRKKKQHTDASYFSDQDFSSIIWMRDVVERKIQWLWPGRIPQGKLVTLAGPGGVGKSFLLCDMAARVSSGLEWPFSGGECAPVGNVLVISGEDELEDTIKPRLRLQGAHPDRVAFPSSQELVEFNLSGPKFKEVADRMLASMGGASLLIIDPPSSFLAGIDENSNAEVRGFLTPMKIWAHENNCAIIFNTHVNKASNKKLEIQQRVIGSVAMVNGPRMSHMVVASEEDTDVKLFVPLKSNIWKRLPAISFRIVPDLHELDHARLEWIAEIDVDAGTAMNGREGKGEADHSSALDAERWVIEQFREKPSWDSKDLMEKAVEELGDEQISSVKRARTKLGVKTQQIDRKWRCWVPVDWEFGK